MNVSLLLHTLKHLRIEQIAYQVRYRMFRSTLIMQSSPHQIKILNIPEYIRKVGCINELGEFKFLNISDSFSSWNATLHGMLWAYNLNYMDWLCQEGMTFEVGAKWIDKFIDDLSDNRIGLDPYPIALRGINWIKFICAYHEQIDAKRLKKWNDSLYSQYLLLEKKLEYHLLGNHLLEDAYSLFIAAIYFSDDRLYKKSAKLLKRELDEQILSDGAHYEQSPMYHCILLDRLLDCYNISLNNIRFAGQEQINAFLCKKAEMMLGHLENIIYENGDIPLLNDAAYGIAPTAVQLKEYAKRLDVVWKPKTLKECGYRKMKSEVMEAFIDVGNLTATYQPGHTHADTFNFELRLKGKPFIVDTGISTYDKTQRRQYERSTVAHNTVSVQGKDSSEVWGGFRVGRRAKVEILKDTNTLVEARHDGFGNKCLHTRSFKMTTEGFFIYDQLSCAASGCSRLHFAPHVEIISLQDNTIVTNMGEVVTVGATQIKIIDEKVSMRYNEFNPIKVAEISFSQNLKIKIHKTN